MNNIPEGYKQTEVGVIPMDWEAKTLGDAAEVVMGQSPVGASYNHSGTGAPLINGPTEFTEKYPIKIQWTSQPTKFCKKCDMLLCVRGSSTGRINISDGEYCIGRGIAAIRAKSGADTSFITFQVESAVKSILALTTGSTFPNIDGKSIRAIQFPLPPLPEQQAIASALTDVDALITALGQLITKKRYIKQGAMQQLLTGKKRLPGFGGEWEVKKLGEILLKTQLGGNYPNSEKETNYPLMKMGNINRGLVDISKIEYITDKSSPSEKDKLQYGDVLFNTRNTLELVGKVAIWRNELPLAYFNSNLLRFEFNPSHVSSKFFMNNIFNTKQILSQLKGFATGTTSVAAIYSRDLIKLQIPLPPLPEQTAIATILSDMDAEIEALEQKQTKYKAIKQGMMQELLTGKTRLV